MFDNIKGEHLMEHFETKVTIGKSTTRELRKYLKHPREKMRVAIVTVVVILIGILFVVLGHNIGFLLIIFAPFLILINHLSYLNVSKVQEKRRIESAGGRTEIEIMTSFTEEGVTLTDLATNNSTALKYDIFERFAETERFYALFTKAHQHILVDKLHLIQEGKDKAFLSFIKEKCVNIR